MRPSCGMRRSAMSRSARIFTRETTAGTALPGITAASVSTPSIRYRTRMSSSPGSKWMSDEPRSTASLITRCTSWMTEASSPEAPKVIGALSRRAHHGPAGRRGGAVAEVRVLHAVDEALDVGRGGNRRADLVAGHDRDVVLREDVRGVRHGDQQRALAGERDRDGLVAPGRGGRDELGRVGVDAV